MHYFHIPMMLYKGILMEDKKIKQLMDSRYGTQLMTAYAILDREELYLTSKYHGQGHIERTMLLGALIAMGENFTEEETRHALFCCAYHDTGRRDDSRDDYHGLRSADIIIEDEIIKALSPISDGKVAALQAAICTHSMHDSTLMENMEKYGVPKEEQEYCRKICWCLKDADNLDRVRINDLDPKYLRTNAGRNMVDTCWYILNTYIDARRNKLA